MSGTSVRRRLLQLVIIFGCWTILAFLAAVHTYAHQLAFGMTAGFLTAFGSILKEYWIWALLTPFVLVLAKRFPFTARNWLPTALIHVASYLVFTWAFVGLSALVGIPIGIPSNYYGWTIWLRFTAYFYDSLWMYGPIVLVCNLLEYYQRYKERTMQAARLQAQLSRAEFEALRHQLHPHFLFNTLNSIASLMHEDVEAADDMLADLSSMLRAYLKGFGEQETTLARELMLLETYLRIQKRRFEDRLSYSVDVPHELLQAQIPTLVLQPFVENAILHGLAPREHGGHLAISARSDDVSLVLQIQDNGLGLAPEYTEGVGIGNSRARLAQLYGKQQSLQISGNGRAGVVVVITLPLHFERLTFGVGSHEDSDRGGGRRAAGAPADSVSAQV